MDNFSDVLEINNLPGHIIDDIYNKLNMTDLINTASQSKTLLYEYKTYQKNKNIDPNKYKNLYNFTELIKKYKNIKRYKDTITVRIGNNVFLDIILQASDNIFLYLFSNDLDIEAKNINRAIITYNNVSDKYENWEKNVFVKNYDILSKYNNDIMAVVFVVIYKYYKKFKNQEEDIQKFITFNDIKFQ